MSLLSEDSTFLRMAWKYRRWLSVSVVRVAKAKPRRKARRCVKLDIVAMLEEESGFVEKRKDRSRSLSMGSRQPQLRVILQGK